MYKFILIISLFILTGCVANQNENSLNNFDKSDIKSESSNDNFNKIESSNNKKMHFEKISPNEFKEKLKNKEYVLVDIRTKEEYDNERISGVDLNLDYYSSDFRKKVSKLDKNKTYLYYCRSGHRSGEVTSIARDFGFREVYGIRRRNKCIES